MTLVRVENAFRTLKHDLALRPVCHHLEERAKAHVLFCWIAYAMYWMLERTHHQRGGSLSGRRVLEVLRGIQMGTMYGMAVESNNAKPLKTRRQQIRRIDR